jgi:hypothetical protein
MKMPWYKMIVDIPHPIEKALPDSFETSYPIPTWDLSIDNRKEYRRASIKSLGRRFTDKLGSDGIYIRQLLASDLGLKSWRTPAHPPGSTHVWINHTLGPAQSIIIIGITQLSRDPKVSEIIFRRGATGQVTLGHLEIDELYSFIPLLKPQEKFRAREIRFERFGSLDRVRMTAYFSEPYYYDINECVHIMVRSPEDNKAGDKLMLKGYIAEPEGLTIV